MNVNFTGSIGISIVDGKVIFFPIYIFKIPEMIAISEDLPKADAKETPPSTQLGG